MKLVNEGQIKLMLTKGVFYNPRMAIARDLNISICSQLNGSYLDALAATGVSGIRIGKELGLEVALNDANPRAAELIQLNLKLNQLSAQVFNRNANSLMHESRYGIVEIDPFGSPVEFIDAGISCCSNWLIVTATDTAPLCGVHPSGLRRYSAQIFKTPDHPEIKLRVLLGYLLRQAAKLDRALKPLASIGHQHFLKLWMKLESGAAKADAELRTNLGFIHHCERCFSRELEPGILPQQGFQCCGEKMKILGPVYLGALHSPELIARARDQAKLRGFKQAFKLLDLCSQELNWVGYYDYHLLCSQLKLIPKPMPELIQILIQQGFSASRTHLTGTGFKTDASRDELVKLLASCSA